MGDSGDMFGGEPSEEEGAEAQPSAAELVEWGPVLLHWDGAAWTGYDWSRYVGDEAQETEETTNLRDYWRHYPGILRPYVSISHILNRDIEWFGRIDNLTNVQRFERDNLQVTAGRTMTVGVRIGRN